MAKAFYLVNQKTGKRYRVIRRDTEKGLVYLKGSIAEFSVPYDPDELKRLGYKLETVIEEEEADAE